MTYGYYKKALKQLKEKPEKMRKFLKHNAPKKRTTGIAQFRCRRCLRIKAFIKKYNLQLCRQCFREIAPKIGFTKFS